MNATPSLAAHSPGTATQSQGTQQFLTFLLDGEHYGIDILSVQEIRGWDRVTQLPNSPDFLLGVTNLRGAILPVVDLRRRLGLASVEVGATTVVIVVTICVEGEERNAGLVVDAVADVHDIADTEIRTPPEIAAREGASCVRGLVSVDEKLIILVHPDVLIGAEAAQIQAALGAAQGVN